MPKRRVLVITPWVPYPVTGACQQDRWYGLLQMQKLGYELRVIAKIHTWQPRAEIEAHFAAHNIPLTLVPYVTSPARLAISIFPQMLRQPALLDGAALEYADPDFLHQIKKITTDFAPDVAWVEYTLLWPVIQTLKQLSIPVIMKSSLNEPANCRDEHGWSITSVIKSLPKYLGERIAARSSDALFAITPDEETWYKSWGARRTGVLPLRGLSRCLQAKTHTEKEQLDVIFLSSNYNMGHNRDAMDFLLRRVLPLIRQAAPGKFRFHLTGSKFPRAYQQYLGEDAKLTGFVENLDTLFASMDMAVAPWISGQGMQQKVFEPLCRGLPLITHKTAGYPFTHNQDILLAQTPEAYTKALLELTSREHRQAISDAGYKTATRLFAETVTGMTIEQAMQAVTKQS